MARHLGVTIEHANDGLGGNDGQGLFDQNVRDGVVVFVEAQIGSFSRRNDPHRVGRKRMLRERQQPRPLFVEGFCDALVRLSRNRTSVSNLLDPRVELAIEVSE